MFKTNATEILNCLEHGVPKNFNATKNIEIKKIATNHGDVEKKSAFIALKGLNFDGHRFAECAIKNGAEFAIVETELPSIAQIVVKNCKKALLDIAALNRRQFNKPIVAITGSAGKTTTKELIALALADFDKSEILKTEQNLNNEIGVSQTLLKLNSNQSAAVIELGMSHKNEISALSRATKPNIAVITNIGCAHFENFKNLDEILQAKLEIVDGLEPNGTLILNDDDFKLEKVSFKNKLTCSIKNPKADFFASNIETNYDLNNLTTSFDLHFNNKTIKISIPTFGIHNISNTLLAFASATSLGANPEKIARNLLNFKPIGFRQKILKLETATIIADCYNANPQTMTASLISFSQINCSGKKIAILGDMLELGSIAEQSHTEIGTLLNNLNIDYVACIGNLAKLISSTTTKPVEHFANKTQLINFLKQQKNKFKMFLFKASRKINLEHVIEQTFGNQSLA